MQFCHLTLPTKVIQTQGNFVKLWNTAQRERKQLKCCRRASFLLKKQLRYWFAAPVNITTPLITESKGESKREHDLQGGELTWRLLIPFVLQFVITLLTRDCSAHKTRKARNHIVYIMSRAHTVNTRCAYTLNLEYTHKQKEQKTERATSAAKSCSSWHSRSQLRRSIFYCTLNCLTPFFFPL